RAAGAGKKVDSRQSTIDSGKEKSGAPPDLFALALTSQGEALYQAGSYADAAVFRGSPHLARGLYLLALARQGRAEAGEGGDPAAARDLLERLAGPEFAKDPISEEADFFLAGIL